MNVYERAELIQAKLESSGFEKLSSKEKIVIGIVEFEAEINNGGFDQLVHSKLGCDKSVILLESKENTDVAYRAGFA